MVNSTDTQATQTSNRGGILKVLARLATTGIISFGIGGAVTFDRYNNYWNQTIFRVQTVDFNILSHTLPTKLSYAIAKNQPEEVQRTLDSNYNLFGLIITDSSGQKIIAHSGKNSGRSLSWKAALDPQQLQNHPYDVLLDPPPLFAQWTYSKPQATERSATSLTNRGRVIGRVYYVRGVRPTFQEDIATFLSNPFSGSSRIQTYATTLAACFGGTFLIWSILEFILYKRRVEIRIAREKEETLNNNNRILQFQLTERIHELQLLQNQREDERNEFNKEADKLHSLNNRLKNEIFNLRDLIKNLSTNTDSTNLQIELKNTRLQSQENLDKKKQYEQDIKELNKKLQIIQNKQLETLKKNEQKENELQEIQQQIQEIETSRSLAESQLEELRSHEENYKKIVAELEEQLNQKNFKEEELQKQLENLQNSLSEYQEREQLLEKLAEQAKAESEALGKEIARYKEDTGKHPLNDFEVSILNYLQQKFSDKKVFVQFDVGNGRQGSMSTDFIIAMNNCCIVIEAKSYTGKIKAIGYPRNTGWICITNTKIENINACWGKNPYEQIWTYSVSLYGRIKISNRNKLPVFGIVVFPKDAVVDNNIQSNISNFYRVTTLDNLSTAIQELENQARFQNKTRLTYEQILEKLTGISDQ
ncbi:hypothetical protein NIES22_71120 (plasmid) [Calothrix brevissima NIES-22]|nr:hypothetical protein NIES22_71120 [Calothrix brevissima NIES-22]